MRIPIIFLFLLTFAWGCEQSSPEGSTVYTGKSATYSIIGGTFFGVQTSGEINVRERTDQSVEITVSLSGTNGEHPVHLHYDDLLAEGGVAAVLNPIKPVEDNLARSTTIVSYVQNKEAGQGEEVLSFTDFQQMNGCIRIHQEKDGQFKDYMIGAANIGVNKNPENLTANSINTTRCNSNLP
jgi:hypothetical protein